MAGEARCCHIECHDWATHKVRYERAYNSELVGFGSVCRAHAGSFVRDAPSGCNVLIDPLPAERGRPGQE